MHRNGLVVLLCVLAAPVHAGDADPEAAAASAGASIPAELPSAEPVVVWGRTLVSYRLPLEFKDASDRARATEARIRSLLGAVDSAEVHMQPVSIGEARGVVVMAGGKLLLSIMEGDLEPGADLDDVAASAAAELRRLLKDHATQHDVSFLLSAIVASVVATAVFIVFWTGVLWVRALLLKRVLSRKIKEGTELRFFGYDVRPVLLAVTITVTRILALVLILAAAYGWMTFVLGRFPYTRHWGDQLGGYLVSAVAGLAGGLVDYLPNLAILVVIFIVTRVILRILNAWFAAIESGRYFSSWLDPEAARASRRLAGIGIWVVALIVAFPHLPGAHSEAFKGVSVFVGLMVSLGGAGFVGQIIGGLAAVYTRAVRTGDYIAVGDSQGVVTELGMLSTKIVTRTREEVTIPNATLINTAIRNLSRGANNATIVNTAVTIGYDTPWRQVQALLLLAADRTDGLLKSPKPRVLQTALDDFYVRYELSGYSETPYLRAEVLARLHGNIQDLFNEHGVQIMSPHFRSQPSQSLVVPKEKWVIPPAEESPAPPP